MNKKNKRSNNLFPGTSSQSGAAMLIAVIFLIFISLAVISGLVVPSVREFKVASESINSKKSYFLAESGIEDAFYRILTNKPISGSEVITIGSNSATTEINSVGNSKREITSVGDVLDLQRKVNLSLQTGSGVVFKYGTQAGQGGITFSNNAGLYGSLYSNGDITGSNNAFITGDAYAANSPAVSADQSNGDDNTPSNSVSFGNANGTQDFAQSFRLSSNGFLNKVQIRIKKIGTPANATIRVTTDTGGHPNTTNVATGTLNAGLVTGSYGWIDVSFTTNPQVIENMTYWLVIDSATNVSSYYNIAANTLYQNGLGKIGQYNGTWNDTSPTGLDGYFKIYLGGVTGEISGIDIGENGVGNAYAHTLTNNNIAGNAYCQTGSGNNKQCDTSKSDPVQENMPISDANIAEWKADAELGGVTNGNVTISGNQSLGPKKIVGNLTVSGTLTISDTIWVTGNISITGKVKLAPSYLATTGIIISDGYISIGNNSEFNDSGTAGSYILLLSTSSCDTAIVGNPCGTHNAIEAENNSDLIIANAQKGAIIFSNNAGVKELAANRIYLSNNATITYGSGIMSIDFTSGPSGGWNVGGWKETQ